MKHLIESCVRRPVSVIMVLAAIFLGGIYSFSILPLQRLPEFPFPRVTVETLYPGLGAEDIRSVITIPIEDALSPVKGLERMRSVSRDGASLTVLDFRWGVDSGAASVLVREAIDAVYPSLPEGASKPSVIPGNPDEEPQLIVAIRSRLGLSFARNLAEYEIRSIIRRIDGVSSIMLSGGEKEELAVKVNIQRAIARGLPPSALAEIIAGETANIPAGNAREGDKELVVVSQGRPETETGLRNIIFPSQSGAFVIDDIGTLTRKAAKKDSIFIVSGKSGQSEEYVSLEIFRRPGADPVKLSADLKKAIREASSGFGRDAEINIIYDAAASVISGIQKLFVSVILGTSAVMIVLFFTLRSWRYSILAGLSLPVSMAASLMALSVLGRTLNNMSLSGIALGIGLVSDISVIIIDILHQSFGGKEKLSYKELSEKSAQVLSSSLGGTATTVVVFIPIVFLPGPLGSLFGDLSVSLVVSIITAWVYAQFALPALFLFSASIQKKSPVKESITVKKNPINKNLIEDFLQKIQVITLFYEFLLKKGIQKPKFVLYITLLFCAAGFAMLVTRPFVFVSADAAEEIHAALNFPSGATMDSIAREASLAGEQLAAIPGITYVFGRAGSEEDDAARRSDPDYRKETFLFRCLLDSSYKPASVLSSVQQLLQNQNAAIYFPQDKTEKILGLSSSYLIAVKGKDKNETEARAAEAETLIRQSGNALTITRRPAGLRKEIRVLPDRETLAYSGLRTIDIARALYAAAEGLEAGTLEPEGKPLTIKVSAMDLPELEAIPVALGKNGPIFTGAVTRIENREAAAALARLDRSDTLYIETVPMAGCEKTLRLFLASLCGKEKSGGFFRADESAFARYRSSLILTVILVLLLLYLTMGALFESFILPLVLMLAIPFSLAGAGPALFLCGAGLDSSSILALMVLFGVSINSGMVLYELSLEKILQKMSAEKAVRQAATERFRPILATTLTTLFALLPLLISPLGAKEHSMAAAMFGGIIASTALSLFALPPVLIRFLRYKRGV